MSLLSDELHDVIAQAALLLPPSLRSAAHRIAAEEQRHFLKAGPVAVSGSKYGRTDTPKSAR